MLVLLLVMLMTMTNHTTAIVRTASSRVDAFQTARMAFDTITRRLSQATMNTYWDYYNSTNQRRDPSATSGPTSSGSFVPATYGRASDLHFLIQANSHLGQSVYFAAPEARSADTKKDQTQGLLNAIGYFVQYGGDDAFRPGLIAKPRYRYRLMQAIQPTENFQIYSSGSSSWVPAPNGAAGSAWPVADNVIALIAWPRLSAIEDVSGTSISANYQYDSRTTPPTSGKLPIQYAQMPPDVQVTMVVIDESSAVRMDTASGTTEPKVISDALTGLFADVTKYQQDLDALTGALSRAHINYEVFSSMVSLRESKWSSQ